MCRASRSNSASKLCGPQPCCYASRKAGRWRMKNTVKSLNRNRNLRNSFGYYLDHVRLDDSAASSNRFFSFRSAQLADSLSILLDHSSPVMGREILPILTALLFLQVVQTPKEVQNVLSVFVGRPFLLRTAHARFWRWGRNIYTFSNLKCRIDGQLKIYFFTRNDIWSVLISSLLTALCTISNRNSYSVWSAQAQLPSSIRK